MSRTAAGNVAAALALLTRAERATLASLLHFGREDALGKPYDEAGNFLGDDTDCINGFRHLIDSIASADDPPNIAKDKPGPRDQWCSICHQYHFDVGEKTDAGRITRSCPLHSAAWPWNCAE